MSTASSLQASKAEENIGPVLNQLKTVDSALNQLIGPTPGCNSIADPEDEKSCGSVFSLHPLTKYCNFPAKDWLPYCSLNWIHDEQKAGAKDLMQILKNAHHTETELDSCANTAEMRGSPNYAMPTQNSYLVKLMSLDARLAYEQAIQSQLHSEAIHCCGEDAECKKIFENIKITWCKPQTDPAKPDPCIDDTTAFQRIDDTRLERLAKSRNASLKVSEYQPDSGEITFSPLQKIITDAPHDGPDVIAHELGHSCSSARIQLAIKRGVNYSKAAILAEIKSDPGKGRNCSITPEVKQRYQEMFETLGSSKETFDCLTEVAHNNTRLRFKSGLCPGGCPIAAIEESFADFMRDISLTPADGKKMFPEVCIALRDNAHPLGADELRCELKTPALVERFKTWSGCAQ